MLLAPEEALVNPVSCIGVMGAGLPQQCKVTWPEKFAAWAAACRRSDVRPERVFAFETQKLSGQRLTFNLPTRRQRRDGSRLEDVEAGLAALATEIGARAIRSVAVPAAASLGPSYGQASSSTWARSSASGC